VDLPEPDQRRLLSQEEEGVTETQPRHSLRSFLRAFYQGCQMHGCCFEEHSECDLRIEVCPSCLEPFVCTSEDEWHWCSEDG